MSGRVEFSIDGAASCCPPAASDTPSFRVHCCHFEQYSLELDEQISPADEVQWLELFVAQPMLPIMPIVAGFDQLADAWHFTDPSPPDGASTILLRKQSFLI